MVPKTGELHRHAFVTELIGRKWELAIFAITARVIELGSRASYTLRARSPPQHRSLGNVPGIKGFAKDMETTISGIANILRKTLKFTSWYC